MSSKKRIESIDMTKGLLMFYVVILHVTALTMIGTAVLQTIFTGAMITYFVLSGYTYTPGKRTYTEDVIKRIKQLLIPYVIYFIGIFVLTCLLAVKLDTVSSFMDGISYFPSVFMDKVNVTSFYGATSLDFNYLFYAASAPMWFLTGMITATFIFCAIGRFIDKSRIVRIFIIVGLLAVSCILKLLIPKCVFFDIQDAPAFAALMFTGLVLKKNGLIENRKLKGIWLIIYSIVVCVFNFFMLMTIGGPFGLSGGSWGKFGGYSVFTGYIIGMLSLFMYVYICDALKNIKIVNKVLTYIGQNTLHILLIHCPIGLVLLVFTNLLHAKKAPTTQTELLTFLLALVSLALSTLYVAGLNAIKKKIHK